MKRKTEQNRISGSTVLEYTIVFPLVLFIVFALLFMGFALHQRAVLDSAVNRASIMAARMLSDPQYESIVSSARSDGDSPDFDTNQYNFKASNFQIEPYRYIFNYSGNSSKAEIEEYIQNIIDKNSIWGTTSDVEITIDYKNYVLYQEIHISAKQEFTTSGLLTLLGLEEKMTIQTAAMQVVMDPDEFIRNVDLVLDIINDVTGTNIEGSMQKVMDKIVNFSNTLFKKK